MPGPSELPTGHGYNGAYEDPNVPPTNNGRVMTAIRSNWTPSDSSQSLPATQDSSPFTPSGFACILEAPYQKILNDLPDNVDYAYRQEIQNLCVSFQEQGASLCRPPSDDVKDLFRAIPFPKTNTTGKGSKGGMLRHECLWPDCDFNDTLQKCMDHLFSKHMKVKFFQCGIDDCKLSFTRKFDLDKHKQRTHGVARPRAARNGDTPTTPRRPKPYSRV